MNMDWIKECFPDYEIIVEYDNIDDKEKKTEIHGLKEQTGMRCMFCGKPYEKWRKKDIAHAISECVGNKSLINLCECYDCNHLFGEIAENHLGKFIMPYRFINDTYGKRNTNVIKDKPKDETLSYDNFRFEQKKNSPIFQSDTFEVKNMLIEKAGTGRLTQLKNGFVFSIPRQKYQPTYVYVSLLKMAYTLLPINEMADYIRGLCAMYLAMSLTPIYDINGNIIAEKLTVQDKQDYTDNLPNIGIEICISSDKIPNGVNVCLLKNIKSEPKLLFAIQMKWYTIVIPVLSDNYQSGEIINFRCRGNENISIRKLDFSNIEPEFLCEMSAKLIDIPCELYSVLENDLRSSRLLK